MTGRVELARLLRATRPRAAMRRYANGSRASSTLRPCAGVGGWANATRRAAVCDMRGGQQHATACGQQAMPQQRFFQWQVQRRRHQQQRACQRQAQRQGPMMPAPPQRGTDYCQYRGEQREHPFPARHDQQGGHQAVRRVLERTQRHQRRRHEGQQQRQGDAMCGAGHGQPGGTEIEAGMPACRCWRLGGVACGKRGDVVHNVT